MKKVIIIEARMSSTRLHGKVLLEVSGKPLLFYLLKRLKKVKNIDQIVIATTTNKSDDVIIKFAKKNKIDYFRGSEDKVLERVVHTGVKFKADIILSITADCPLIDISIIEQCLKTFCVNDIDFLTNAHHRSYPDGMDVQIFKLTALKKSLTIARSLKDFEHTSYVMRKNPKIFKTYHLLAPSNLTYPDIGLTVDELEDFILIKKLILNFKNNYYFTCADILKLLKKNKNLLKINSSVKRNSYFLKK